MSTNCNILDVILVDPKILFEYSQALRDRYLEELTKLPWEEVVKSRGGSFDSLRDIFLHTIDAEDRLVNYVIPGRTEDWVLQSQEEFRDTDSIRKRVKEVGSRTNAYVRKMTHAELGKKVEMPRRGMPGVLVRVEDVLIHAALENIHHFGELIALLWQIDVEPPHMGWIGYIQK